VQRTILYIENVPVFVFVKNIGLIHFKTSVEMNAPLMEDELASESKSVYFYTYSLTHYIILILYVFYIYTFIHLYIYTFI